MSQPFTTSGVFNSSWVSTKRKPKKRRDLPTFTSGLENKLMDCIGEDATKIIRYLTRKIDSPTKTETLQTRHYEFHKRLTCRIHTPITITPMDAGFFDPFGTINYKHKTVDILVRLTTNLEGILQQFSVQLGGH